MHNILCTANIRGTRPDYSWYLTTVRPISPSSPPSIIISVISGDVQPKEERLVGYMDSGGWRHNRRVVLDGGVGVVVDMLI